MANIADFDGFEESMWFSKQAMTNILSLAKVKQEYWVSYDGDDFIVHRSKHGFNDMVFKLHPSGLHAMTKMILGVWPAILSLQPYKRICLCSPSAR